METLHIVYAAQIAHAALLSLRRRIRPVIVASLLALSLMLSVPGTASQVSAAPRKPTTQPPVGCTYYSRGETKAIFGFDPGPGGYWDCVFIDLDAPRAH